MSTTSHASSFVFEDKVALPTSIRDMESFRQWARSDECPEGGWFSYLGGEVWVDLSMEQLFSHNRVKAEITAVLVRLVKSQQRGYLFADRARLSHISADLSTEPDCLFVSYESVKDNRAQLIEGADEGYVEVEGSPDMVLEIISPTSVRKDTVRLRELYHRAGVAEYWLVDAREDEPRLEILRREANEYAPVEPQDGWTPSPVFGRKFQLRVTLDPLGHPDYTLDVG
ncbi:MAG: Uma2 family endonuclease [Planctomycetes bacterium]|nr:Uma2 family endonuclease [Planctomycetota bacterium]